MIFDYSKNMQNFVFNGNKNNWHDQKKHKKLYNYKTLKQFFILSIVFELFLISIFTQVNIRNPTL